MDGLGLWVLLASGVFVLGALRVMGNRPTPHTLPRPQRDTGHPPPRVFSPSALAQYDGTKGKSVYIAVQPKPGERAVVFDVTPGASFYGPGGPYHVFAGKNASRGLARVSTAPEDASGPIDSLSASERDTLFQWYEKYMQKYEVIGHLED